jgi:hypothetical protein
MRRYWRIWSAPAGTTTGRSPGTLTWRSGAGAGPGAPVGHLLTAAAGQRTALGAGEVLPAALAAFGTDLQSATPSRSRPASTSDAGRAPPRANERKPYKRLYEVMGAGLPLDVVVTVHRRPERELVAHVSIPPDA